MRFESLLWTVLALFVIGSGTLAMDTPATGGVDGPESTYQASDGGNTIPPPLMDGGTTVTTTTSGQLTK